MSDAQFVEQTRAGHDGAYEELVRRWAPRVLAFCRCRVRREDVAEDLAQEALIRGYRRIRSLREPAKFGAWLIGIAELVCRDWRRRRRPDLPLEDRAANLPDPADGVDVAAEKREELVELWRAVDALPALYRDTLTLYYSDDFTYQDLAEALDVSVATINARLTHARLILRERLAKLRK